MSDYIEINRKNWDSRVEFHLGQYDLDKFRADPSFISDVVRFDVPRLGDVTGLDIVHLQCHIGTDTLSLARLGAKSITGVDFSPKSIAAARDLASELGIRATFIESNVYDALEAVTPESFDLVYTGIGALCWLSDIAGWAKVVAGLLRSGGELFIREGHPMLNALGDVRPDGAIPLEYSYFETTGIAFSETSTYVEHEGELSSPDTIQFSHGIAEIITALQDAGMEFVRLYEHQSIPWNQFGDSTMTNIGGGEYALSESPARLAASFTLRARKY